MLRDHGKAAPSWSAFVEALGAEFDLTRSLAGFDAFIAVSSDVARETDRWVLTSNLHKAVRLGLVVEATATADALHQCDPEYFWRRLPVLAIEDVSLGNPRLAAEVLAFSRSAPLRRRAGPERLAGYLTARLALATKCRSPCDLLCLVNAARGGEDRVQAEMESLGVDWARQTASDTTLGMEERALALLKLDRLPMRGGDLRAGALAEVCGQLGTPPLLRQIVLAGKPTSGLAVVQLLAFELLAKTPPRVTEADPGLAGEQMDGPILYSALDKHTRLGQAAIREWAIAVLELAKVLSKLGPPHTAQRIVRLGLFHIESGVLHRRLTNDPLDQLLADTERIEMQALGVAPGQAAELYAVMRANHRALHEIRRAVWTRSRGGLRGPN